MKVREREIFTKTNQYWISIFFSIPFFIVPFGLASEWDKLKVKTRLKKIIFILLSILSLILGISMFVAFITPIMETPPIEYTLKKPLTIDIEEKGYEDTTLYLNEGDKVTLVIKDPISMSNKVFDSAVKESKRDKQRLKESDWKNADVYILLDKERPDKLIQLSPIHVKNQGIDEMIKEIYKKEIKKDVDKKKMTDLLTKFDIGIAIVACLLIFAVIVDRTK